MFFALTRPQSGATCSRIYDAILALAIRHHFYAAGICGQSVGLCSDYQRERFLRDAGKQIEEAPEFEYACKIKQSSPRDVRNDYVRLMRRNSTNHEPEIQAVVAICERTGRMIGFVLFQTVPKDAECFLSHYFVHPEWRGHGTCAAMLDYLTLVLRSVRESRDFRYFTHSLAFADPQYEKHKRYLLSQKGARVKSVDGYAFDTAENIIVVLPTLADVLKKRWMWALFWRDMYKLSCAGRKDRPPRIRKLRTSR